MAGSHTQDALDGDGDLPKQLLQRHLRRLAELELHLSRRCMLRPGRPEKHSMNEDSKLFKI